MGGSRPKTLADHLKHPVEEWRLSLISSHLASVQRHVTQLARRYPGHDVEPMAFQALYLAALTYRPGKQGFHRWLRSKMCGAMSNFRRLDDRREMAGIALVQLDDEMVHSLLTEIDRESE